MKSINPTKPENNKIAPECQLHRQSHRVCKLCWQQFLKKQSIEEFDLTNTLRKSYFIRYRFLSSSAIISSGIAVYNHISALVRLGFFFGFLNLILSGVCEWRICQILLNVTVFCFFYKLSFEFFFFLGAGISGYLDFGISMGLMVFVH